MEKIIREMIAKDYKIRPSAKKILNYPKLRAITKQDKDYPRVDYAVCTFILYVKKWVKLVLFKGSVNEDRQSDK